MQDHLCASVNRVDDRHRRYPASGGSGGGQLAVPDHGEVVATAAVRGGGDQFGQRGQRAQALATPQGLDGHGRVVAQSRGAFVVTLFGERAHLTYRCAQRVVVLTVNQGRGPGHRRRVLGGRHVAGGGA